MDRWELRSCNPADATVFFDAYEKDNKEKYYIAEGKYPDGGSFRFKSKDFISLSQIQEQWIERIK